MTEVTDQRSDRDAEEVPWHLSGNFAPVFDEVTVDGLDVDGEIPEALHGTYFRNGFDPRHGHSDHWFYGHGMIHAVDLADGAAAYRNRWVRTPYWEQGAGGMGDLLDPANSPANTHVVSHAGSLLALEEMHAPWRVGLDLETLGMETFGGGVTGAFTAHPKICPDTGELLAFGYDLVNRPHLTYYRIGADGGVLAAEPIELPNPVMMHDWGVTRNNVVFMDLPVVLDMAKLGDGGPPLTFRPSAGARLGVMPRNGTDRDVVWHEIDPCYVFHPVNAHEEDDRIVLTVCRLRETMGDGFDDFGEQARLWRWTIDTAAGTVREEQLDDRAVDFPRVDDRLVGRHARYGYVGELAEGHGHPAFGSRLLKYDLATGEAETHDCGAGRHIAEPVFAPAGPDAGEDEGFVMAFIYDEETDGSELRILDARDFTDPPVARVRLPRRIPFGAHGSWVPSA